MEEVMKRTVAQRNASSHRKKTRRTRFYDLRVYKKIVVQLTVSSLILLVILIARGTDKPLTKGITQSIESYLSSSIDWPWMYKVLNEWTQNTVDYAKTLINQNIKDPAAKENKPAPEVPAADKGSSSNLPSKSAVASVESKGGNQVAIVPVFSSISSVDMDAKIIKSSFALHAPVEGFLSSRFGLRIHPISHKEEYHSGIDIGAYTGTPIYAAMAGEAIEARRSTTYGNMVKILSGKDVVTIYAHCQKLLVKKGQKVSKGRKIALVGNTGLSNGPHLHFEVSKANRLVDPAYLFSKYK